MKGTKCDICGKTFPPEQLISGHGIRHEVEGLIRKEHPGWTDAGHICHEDYNAYRLSYIVGVVESERGSIEQLEKAVVESIRKNEIITVSSRRGEDEITVGGKVADLVAAFGGSWRFIIIFFIMLAVWIVINTAWLVSKPFDPYPFILMNLILSCLAAIQAPIIMMSQNRQEKKDRWRAESDYKVNLKSEIEIRTLHEKVDHLLLDQWSKMMRVQEIQIEILEEIRRKLEK
jgi:uncharacterized membrane protein